jgi:uncharacterized protein
VLHTSFEEYKKSTSCNINHFHEKLLLIKDKLNTNAAREIGEKRHTIMLNFLDNFMLEWEGKA